MNETTHWTLAGTVDDVAESCETIAEPLGKSGVYWIRGAGSDPLHHFWLEEFWIELTPEMTPYHVMQQAARTWDAGLMEDFVFRELTIIDDRIYIQLWSEIAMIPENCSIDVDEDKPGDESPFAHMPCARWELRDKEAEAAAEAAEQQRIGALLASIRDCSAQMAKLDAEP